MGAENTAGQFTNDCRAAFEKRSTTVDNVILEHLYTSRAVVELGNLLEVIGDRYHSGNNFQRVWFACDSNGFRS